MQLALVVDVRDRRDGHQVAAHEAQHNVHASVEVACSRVVPQHNAPEVEPQVLQCCIHEGLRDLLLELWQLHALHMMISVTCPKAVMRLSAVAHALLCCIQLIGHCYVSSLMVHSLVPHLHAPVALALHRGTLVIVAVGRSCFVLEVYFLDGYAPVQQSQRSYRDQRSYCVQSDEKHCLSYDCTAACCPTMHVLSMRHRACHSRRSRVCKIVKFSRIP